MFLLKRNYIFFKAIYRSERRSSFKNKKKSAGVRAAVRLVDTSYTKMILKNYLLKNSEFYFNISTSVALVYKCGERGVLSSYYHAVETNTELLESIN